MIFWTGHPARSIVQRNMPLIPTPPAPSDPAPLPRPMPLGAALWRGARNRCPACGEGRVFNGYLRVADACGHCGAALGRVRADDAPPYFTIFLVGHLLLPPILMVERHADWPIWLHMAVWLPLITLACILLLRPVKGATVGLMLHLGITGTETWQPAARRTPPGAGP